MLEEILNAYPVDRLTVGGFSDGASYALYPVRYDEFDGAHEVPEPVVRVVPA